jgi:hypothetical protein
MKKRIYLKMKIGMLSFFVILVLSLTNSTLNGSPDTPIQIKYQQIKLTKPDIGHPITGEVAGSNGGAYQDYSGNYTITYHPATGAHLIYGHIRKKWREMGAQDGPNGYPTTDESDTVSRTGRYNNFQQGTIIYKWGSFEAFSVYGAIYNKWRAANFDIGPLGYPLMNEAATVGNKGIFTDFDNGAIYYSHATKKAYIVRSPVLEAWTSKSRETGKFKFPVEDTKVEDTRKYSQKFEGGQLVCKIKASKSLFSNKIYTRIKPVSRSAVFENTQDKMNPEFKLTFLYGHLKLRTCVVVFEGSYTRTYNSRALDSIHRQYNDFTRMMDKYTFGLCRISHKSFTIHYTIPQSEFTDYKPDDPKFFAEFNSYDMVVDHLKKNGYTPGDFDIISIVLPWQDTATDERSGRAWANIRANMKFNNTTWSTVHNVVPDEDNIYWTFFLHETSHCIYWIFKDYWKMDFEELNPDHQYWRQNYPVLMGNNKHSTFIPKPVNYSLLGIGDFLLYPIVMRWKSRLVFVQKPVYDTISGKRVNWGTWVNKPSIDRGTLLIYSSPNIDLLVEKSVAVTEEFY